MRTIKYRYWNGNDKKMHYKDTWDNFPIAGENECFLQWTGLLDKQGKEIYEFMELDNKYEVIYIAPKYVLQDISNGAIIDLYENKHTITKEYTKI